jgi:hypothetical protein
VSRLYPNPFELIQLGFICRYCGAASGVWCATPSGQWTGYLHSDRYYQSRPENARWRPAGTDFPRDIEAENRLVRVLSEGVTE